MRIKMQFRILTVLLVGVLAVLGWYALGKEHMWLFFMVEAVIIFTGIYLVRFYHLIVKPLELIGNGMDLLKGQDFSSRLSQVGQYEADRIVELFNKMMEQLKEERLLLREQNHFLDLLVNASPMGVVILDLDRRIQSLNPAATRMLGITSQEAIGNSLSSLPSLLAKGLPEIPLHASDTLRLTNASIYKCTHSSFVDRGYNHSFYLIEGLTEEVFKAEKKAYEKVIRMIAHEVNNTTAGITSTLDTLEETLKETAGMEDVSEVLRIAIERCFRMSRFITNFADVVRIPDPSLQPQSLNDMVLSCKRIMETMCSERNIEIRLEPDPANPIVEVDTSLFEQAVLNMIKNAMESIGENGTIYIHTGT
ncbi:MAG: PAS domain-containing protein, partial [Tannerellaceae bacterium]|nr:PAS domain-containing protein [Tannerellaceae bacterium]